MLCKQYFLRLGKLQMKQTHKENQTVDEKKKEVTQPPLFDIVDDLNNVLPDSSLINARREYIFCGCVWLCVCGCACVGVRVCVWLDIPGLVLNSFPWLCFYLPVIPSPPSFLLPV